MAIRVIGPRDHRPPGTIDTTSRSRTWSKGLSPFFVGPVPLYEGASPQQATNVENAWQFAKVYPEHVGDDGLPLDEYFGWAASGWRDQRAHRHPMGKRSPAYSWWDGKRLSYVEARKRIYVPLYAKAVVKTTAFATLLGLYRDHGEVVMWDFDGYEAKKTFEELLNDPSRPLGHAFVLAWLLDNLT